MDGLSVNSVTAMKPDPTKIPQQLSGCLLSRGLAEAGARHGPSEIDPHHAHPVGICFSLPLAPLPKGRPSRRGSVDALQKEQGTPGGVSQPGAAPLPRLPRDACQRQAMRAAPLCRSTGAACCRLMPRKRSGTSIRSEHSALDALERPGKVNLKKPASPENSEAPCGLLHHSERRAEGRPSTSCRAGVGRSVWVDRPSHSLRCGESTALTRRWRTSQAHPGAGRPCHRAETLREHTGADDQLRWARWVHTVWHT
jgi:hypothetical protein